MFKYLCAIPIIFSSYCIAAENNNDRGLYRDNNYNILALAGQYTCGVYSLPNDASDSSKYNDVRVGTAKAEVTPDMSDNSVLIYIDLDTGVKIATPRMPLVKKGSEMTTYLSESKGGLFAYLVSENYGWNSLVQSKEKGSEVSIRLADCKYDKKQ
ncbi:MAG: hypothetical protein E7K97_19615 [Providencia rettgeri]|nr:hypothetical protein [Providencia rettgeri]